MNVRTSKRGYIKDMICVNSDPENSKWGIYAPPGGCTEIVKNVDSDVVSSLCWRCALRAATGKREYTKRD